ncbi:MAG: hypothetical protein M5R41_01095 [Bacteroidia bacterium]|nr:hypothetical protein [Bacteroidia bacterium]
MSRNTFFAVVLLVASAVLSTACSEDPPSINVRNDYTAKVNVQLKPAAGNTVNINDVQSGQTTSFMDVTEGQWTASATIQASSAEPSATFTTSNDNNYTVVITNTEPPTMQIQVGDK